MEGIKKLLETSRAVDYFAALDLYKKIGKKNIDHLYFAGTPCEIIEGSSELKNLIKNEV